MGQTDSFRELRCWQECQVLRQYVAAESVPKLPAAEKFRLADQILRAARSATANIAEGYGRFHYLDEAKFCSSARASSYEVIDHVITAADEGSFRRSWQPNVNVSRVPQFGPSTVTWRI